MRKFCVFLLICLFSLSLIGCSSNNDEELSKIDLDRCISEVRGDSANSLYAIENVSYFEILGLNERLVKNSAISVDTGSKAYCVAIIETDKKEEVTDILNKYSEKRAEELYVQYYDESLIAEKSIIRYLDDYIIFVMGPEANELCDLIENSLILNID